MPLLEEGKLGGRLPSRSKEGDAPYWRMPKGVGGETLGTEGVHPLLEGGGNILFMGKPFTSRKVYPEGGEKVFIPIREKGKK